MEVKTYIENLGYELISKEYINNSRKLIIKDKYGYYYTIKLNNLKAGYFPCFVEKRNPYTIYNIKLWCKINQKPFKLISEIYKEKDKKLQWQCLEEECGEIFTSSWNEIRNNCGCPFCSGHQVCLSNCLATKNPKLALEWHPTKNGKLTPYDVTANSGQYAWWKCDKGHEWRAIIASRNNGRCCRYCAGQLPSNDYNLLIINQILCEEWNYEKNDKIPEEYCPCSNQKVWWKCSKCNHEWEAIINSRNNGNGCPECNESKGEKQIDYILTKYNIPHDSQYTFDDLRGVGGGLLRYDVPVFWDENKTQLRLLIEYDGRQHYEWIEGWITKDGFETLQIHDKRKDEYCKKHKIKLIRIPYWHFNNIEEILNKELNIIKI